MFGLEEQVQRHKLYSMEYTWMLNKSFECHEKVLFSCQRHFRKKGKTMIMFLSEKHFDIPFRGSLIWMEWMNCWSDQDRNIHSTRFDFATYTKAVETTALFVEKECACFILNTDVDLKIIRFSLLDMYSTSANKTNAQSQVGRLGLQDWFLALMLNLLFDLSGIARIT